MSRWQFSSDEEEDEDEEFSLGFYSPDTPDDLMSGSYNSREYPNILTEEEKCQLQIVPDEDDGWISNDEEHYDDSIEGPIINSEAIVDSVIELWIQSKKKLCQELKKLIYSSFNDHPDPYTLLIAFLNRVGKNRLQPHSVPRIVLSEFQEWHKSSGSGINVSKHHQSAVINVLERCHHVLFDDVVAIFDLMNAERSELVELIRILLESYRHTDASSYTTKLNLQEEFDLKEMLMPLLAMDKMNIIENYLLPYPKLQETFLKYLEELYSTPLELTRIRSELAKTGIQFAAGDKLTLYQLEKLIVRLVSFFKLPVSDYPKIFERRAISSLNYLLKKKYIERTLSDNAVIEAAVKNRAALQYHLITELVCYNDLPAAAYYAKEYKLLSEHLPPVLNEYLNEKPDPPEQARSLYPQCSAVLARNMQKQINSVLTERASECQFHLLKLSYDKILFVDDENSFALCRNRLTKPGTVIGIDAEWRMAVCNNGEERLSLLQLAVHDAVFLLDPLALPQKVSQDKLVEFIGAIFGSKNILKLGYQVVGDIAMLRRTWSFASDSLTEPKRVVDLKFMKELIERAETRITLTPPTSIKIKEPGMRTQYVSTYGRGWSRLFNPSPPSPLFPPSSPLLITPPYFLSYPLPPVQPSTSPTHLASSSKTGFTGKASSPSGLSLLVKDCFGKPLDKTQQLSDWERRPLLVQQVKYAALDAYCLLEVYECLKSQAVSIGGAMPLEPTLEYQKEVLKLERQKRRSEKKEKKAAKKDNVNS